MTDKSLTMNNNRVCFGRSEAIKYGKVKKLSNLTQTQGFMHLEKVIYANIAIIGIVSSDKDGTNSNCM